MTAEVGHDVGGDLVYRVPADNGLVGGLLRGLTFTPFAIAISHILKGSYQRRSGNSK
jgi:hypothetical protein